MVIDLIPSHRRQFHTLKLKDVMMTTRVPSSARLVAGTRGLRLSCWVQCNELGRQR